MKKLIPLVAILMLYACSNIPGAMTPQQSVYAAEQNYAVALTAAVAYKRLPPCPAATAICSDPSIVKQLQVADTAASTLLFNAQTVVRAGGSNTDLAVSAANSAVSAFTTVTKMLK